jgi:threonine/homoserine efflux transporter RhtA
MTMTDPVQPGEPVDPVSTAPPTEPAVPTIASLLSAKSRLVIYAVLGFVNTVLGAVLLMEDVDPNKWVAFAYMVINAAGFGLSGSNVTVRSRTS